MKIVFLPKKGEDMNGQDEMFCSDNGLPIIGKEKYYAYKMLAVNSKLSAVFYINESLELSVLIDNGLNANECFRENSNQPSLLDRLLGRQPEVLDRETSLLKKLDAVEKKTKEPNSSPFGIVIETETYLKYIQKNSAKKSILDSTLQKLDKSHTAEILLIAPADLRETADAYAPFDADHMVRSEKEGLFRDTRTYRLPDNTLFLDIKTAYKNICMSDSMIYPILSRIPMINKAAVIQLMSRDNILGRDIKANDMLYSLADHIGTVISALFSSVVFRAAVIYQCNADEHTEYTECLPRFTGTVPHYNDMYSCFSGRTFDMIVMIAEKLRDEHFDLQRDIIEPFSLGSALPEFSVNRVNHRENIELIQNTLVRTLTENKFSFTTKGFTDILLPLRAADSCVFLINTPIERMKCTDDLADILWWSDNLLIDTLNEDKHLFNGEFFELLSSALKRRENILKSCRKDIGNTKINLNLTTSYCVTVLKVYYIALLASINEDDRLLKTCTALLENAERDHGANKANEKYLELIKREATDNRYSTDKWESTPLWYE